MTERDPTQSAPPGAPDDPLTGHEYDGIKEYDNPTPGWWHLVFIGTAVFSVLYVLVYHFSPYVPPLHERHAAAEAHALEIQFAELNTMPQGTEKVRRIMAQESWLEMGAAIFSGECALCHGENGEGLVGPNLTDEYYKNLTTLEGMIDVVTDGAADGAMPAQKNKLHENEIALVVAYAASLRGKNLQTGPRPAEGEIIAPFPPPLAPDAPADSESSGGTPTEDGAPGGEGSPDA